jgi:hypothetical protein
MSRKGYVPPQVGETVIIAKSIEGWSGGTMVQIVETDGVDSATVRHPATKVQFDVPLNNLKRRRRSHRG